MTDTSDRTNATDGAAGFSLVELVIAMTVTLIITGAVFQLVTAGQTAFRKEPELADRQQNIRVGMDVISQDLYRAGFGIPQFAQVFTQSLNGAGPMGSGGANSDILELVLTTECPSLEICDVNGTQLTTRELLSACYTLPAIVILANDEEWHPMWAEPPGPSNNASCAGGNANRNGHLTFPSGQSGFNPPGGPSHLFANDPEWILVGQIIRYRIQLDADGIPNLERSGLGGRNYPDDGRSSWEIVARGVEDLQVQYENGIAAAGTAWHDDPGAVSCGGNCSAPSQAGYDTIVRRVRVRLSARATGGGNLTGQTTSAVGNAVRGQLVTEIAPRAAATTLGMASGDM